MHCPGVVFAQGAENTSRMVQKSSRKQMDQYFQGMPPKGALPSEKPHSFGEHFWCPKRRSTLKMSIFGALQISSCPKMDPRSDHFRKKDDCSLPSAVAESVLEPTLCRTTPRTHHACHFYDFGPFWDRFFVFLIDFGRISDAFLQDSFFSSTFYACFGFCLC